MNGWESTSRFNARCWMLGVGALGRPRGMVWGGRREEGSGNNIIKKRKEKKIKIKIKKKKESTYKYTQHL